MKPTITIVATITVHVGSWKPENLEHCAERRMAMLKAWLERHWRDLETDVLAIPDSAEYAVERREKP